MSLLRVLPGVAYQGGERGARRQLRHDEPEHQRQSQFLEHRHGRRPRRQRLGSPQIFSGTVNFDAISEVKVQLNNYQAENGRNGGAMVSIVTKSGSKDYRGTGYLYKRHEKLERERLLQQSQWHCQAALPLHDRGGDARWPGAGRRGATSCSSSTPSRTGTRRCRSRSARVTVPTALERARGTSPRASARAAS